MGTISSCGKLAITKKSLRLLNKQLAVIYELGTSETATCTWFLIEWEELQAANVTFSALGIRNTGSTNKLITLRYLKYYDNKDHPVTLIQLINEPLGCSKWQKEEVLCLEIKHMEVHRRVSVDSIRLCPLPDSIWGKILNLKGMRFRKDELNLGEAEMGMR